MCHRCRHYAAAAGKEMGGGVHAKLKKAPTACTPEQVKSRSLLGFCLGALGKIARIQRGSTSAEPGRIEKWILGRIVMFGN